MTERTDHAAKAKRILEAGLEAGRQYHPAVEYAHAQVHATLALVEQQRIANLIAVAQMEGGPHKDVNNWTVAVKDPNGYYVADEPVGLHISTQIREGLGL